MWILRVLALAVLVQVIALAETGSPSWLSIPKNAASEPTTREGRLLRIARGRNYNSRQPISSLDAEPNKDKPAVSIARSGSRGRIDPLPAAMSAAVVVATITDYQPFLSEDHTAIYTELYANVEQVFKDTTKSLTPGSTLTLIKSGGALRLPGGRVIKDLGINGNNFVDVKKRYVLFLTYDLATHAFEILKPWQLIDGRVTPLAVDDRNEVQSGRSRYAEMTESAFLAAVQQQASSR